MQPSYSHSTKNKIAIYLVGAVLIAAIVLGLVLFVKSRETYIQGCGCTSNFSDDHHDDISEPYPDASRQARKCLTGYYGPGCVLSVIPQAECPSNYFSDPQCKKQGCFSTPCDQRMMYDNQINDPQNVNYYEYRGLNDLRQFP